MNRFYYLELAESYRREALEVLRDRKLSYNGRHYEFELAIHHAREALYQAARLH
jgi:hypothetical protein